MAHLSTTGGPLVFSVSSGGLLYGTSGGGLWLGLFTYPTDPGPTGAGTELAGGTYARQNIAATNNGTAGGWTLSYSTGTETASNTSVINVPVSYTSYPVTVGYWGLFLDNNLTHTGSSYYVIGGACTNQVFSSAGTYQILAGNLQINAQTAT